ncbi:MAG: O-antigen/teichoic acid export membrane protein, partial [Crocinitomix sp.]
SEDKEKTFNQVFSIVLVVNAIVLVSLLVFSQSIANWLGHPEFRTYVIWFAFILVFDATSSLLMARLRFLNQPKRFAFIQLSNIGTNIILNLIFIFYFLQDGADFRIGYVFLANLIASFIKPVLLYKDILKFKFTWDKVLVKTMIIFAIPLILAGFAGVVNEVIDRVLLSKMLAEPRGIEYAEGQVGIYSANYKLSILITLFITAFRYAAEPFFFAQEKNKDKNKVYSKVMNYFVIIVTLIFLVISLNLSIFKWFIPNDAYWEGLKIVPILLMANVFLGIYYNQSIWYKLSNKTKYGAYIAVGGALMTLILNITLIPVIGYMGSAIATFAVYFSMMVASYYFGQKHYPIKYNLRKIGLYVISALILFTISKLIVRDQITFAWSTFAMNAILLLVFIGIILFIERPLQRFKKR